VKRVVTTEALVGIISQAMTRWASSADELAELDRTAGDGDLGVTVSLGAAAVKEYLDALKAPLSLAEVVRVAGHVFAEANPSTFSALVGGAVEAAAFQLGTEPSREGLALFVEEARAWIGRRGGAVPGDKTLLDVVTPLADALREEPALDSQPESLAHLAEQAAKDTAGLVPRKGRAAWVGDRAKDQADAGAVALARLVEALACTHGEWVLAEGELPG
jgi:dihydroxyacetone kinase